MGKKDKKKKAESAKKDDKAPSGGGGGGEQKCEPCPVCGKGENPTPGEIPPYVTEQRLPDDDETLIGREGLPAKGGGKRRVKGAKIYIRGNTLVHRDTQHGSTHGKGAELEVYNSTGKEHKGSICAHCGGPAKDPKNYKCDP